MSDGPRVLVVEDNPQLSTILRMAFSHQGYQVDEAGDGQEAIDACHARHERYDLILLDLQMPHMDGLTAARLLREHPETQTALLICLSANLDTAATQSELEALFDATLRKPVSPRDLVKQATAMLAERGVAVPQAR